MSLEIHVGTPIDKCREINTEALEGDSKGGGYAADIFDNLVYRYEEPNGMTRWDSPLFTVTYEDEAPPCQDIWDTMVGSEGKVKTIKPNLATIIVSANLFIKCCKRELTYPCRNLLPSLIISTSLIKTHKKY